MRFTSKQEFEDLLQFIERQTVFVLESTMKVSSVHDFLASMEGMVLFNSTCMCLQSIGEAIRQVDNKTQGHLFAFYPEIPWKQIIGMRNILSHEYLSIDPDLVFDIVREELPLLQLLRQMVGEEAEIDYFCRAPQFFESTPCISHVFSSKLPLNMRDYDVFLNTRRLWNVFYCNWDKLQRLSPKFYNALKKLHEFNKQVIDNYALINLYGELNGKNRREQQDVFGDFALHRDISPYCGWRENAFEILAKHGLTPGRYITISRAADGNYNPSHIKLWPLEYADQAVSLLKESFPSLPIIQVGAEKRYGILKNVNQNLISKTSPDEIKVLLKYALLHIDNDGGLMHLRAALHGKSVIVWGPTSYKNIGYPQNINLNAGVCGPCAHLTKLWHLHCPKGSPAPCMAAVTPQMLVKAAEAYLLSLEAPKLTQTFRSAPPFPEATRGSTGVWEDFSYGPHTQGIFTHYEQGQVIERQKVFCYNMPVHTEVFDLLLCQKPFTGTRQKEFLEEALRLLRPGGSLFVPREMHDSVCQITGSVATEDSWICLQKNSKKS